MPQSLKGLLQSRILERLTLWSCRGFSIIKKNNNQHSLTLGRSGFNVDATFPSEMRGPFFGGNLLITCRTKNKPMHSIAMSRMMESKTGNLNPKLGINWEFQKWPNASNARNFWCHGAPFFCCEGKTPRSPPWVKLWEPSLVEVQLRAVRMLFQESKNTNSLSNENFDVPYWAILCQLAIGMRPSIWQNSGHEPHIDWLENRERATLQTIKLMNLCINPVWLYIFLGPR